MARLLREWAQLAAGFAERTDGGVGDHATSSTRLHLQFLRLAVLLIDLYECSVTWAWFAHSLGVLCVEGRYNGNVRQADVAERIISFELQTNLKVEESIKYIKLLKSFIIYSVNILRAYLLIQYLLFVWACRCMSSLDRLLALAVSLSLPLNFLVDAWPQSTLTF